MSVKDTLKERDFTSRAGGVVRVIDDNGEINGKKRFVLHCSICSDDTELWPMGSISTTHRQIKRGNYGCGCGHNPHLTEYQYLVLVRRECEKSCQEFIGWKGNYSKISSFLVLKDKVTGAHWEPKLRNFLKGEKYVDKLLKHNIEKEAKLRGTVHFHEKDEFFAKSYQYWDYKCYLCAKDEYTLGGACTGVFSVDYNNLKRGSKPCRCSKNHRWTMKEVSFKVESLCYKEGIIFKGWLDKENNEFKKSDKFSWLCKNSHPCVTGATYFIDHGSRCSRCFHEALCFGYFKERVLEQDYLYFINFDNQYLKVGRSFDINRRLKELAKASKLPLSALKVLRVFTGTHQEVYDTEQEIHAELRERGFSCDEVKWSNELFTMDSEYYTNQLLDGIGLTEVDVSTIL